VGKETILAENFGPGFVREAVRIFGPFGVLLEMGDLVDKKTFGGFWTTQPWFGPKDFQ